MTLVLLPRERAVIDKRQRAPRPVKPGPGWYFVLVKRRPLLPARTGTRLETVCELSAPSLDSARTSAVDIIAELRAEHEGRCDDEVRPGDAWSAATAAALNAPSRGVVVGPLVNGTVIEIAARAKVLRRQREMRGTACPTCGGPKARAAVRCRACSADELRDPRPRCPSCERPKSPGAAQCRGCLTAAQRNQRVSLVLAMWRLRADERLNNKQIAAVLGCPITTVAGELSRLRALGYDVAGSPWGNGSRAGTAAHMQASTRSLGDTLRERGILPPTGEPSA